LKVTKDFGLRDGRTMVFAFAASKTIAKAGVAEDELFFPSATINMSI